MLSVAFIIVMLSIIMLIVALLNVVMLIVALLNVVMLSVVAPTKCPRLKTFFFVNNKLVRLSMKTIFSHV